MQKLFLILLSVSSFCFGADGSGGEGEEKASLRGKRHEVPSLQSLSTEACFAGLMNRDHRDFIELLEARPDALAAMDSCDLKKSQQVKDLLLSLSRYFYSQDTACSLVFNSDGSKIAEVLYGIPVKHRLNVWDVNTRNLLDASWKFKHHINSAVFGPDDRLVITYEGGAVRICSADIESCEHVLEGHKENISSIKFNRNGKMLATGSCDGMVKVWSLGGGECIKTFDHDSPVRSIAFDLTGNNISVCDAGNIKAWCIDSGKCVRKLNGNRKIKLAEFNLDGSSLAMVSTRRVKVIDVINKKITCTIQDSERYSRSVNDISFSLDGKRLVISSIGAIKIWNAESGECLQVLGEGKQKANSVVFSPDGSRILSAFGKDRRLWGCDIENLSPEEILTMSYLVANKGKLPRTSEVKLADRLSIKDKRLLDNNDIFSRERLDSSDDDSTESSDDESTHLDIVVVPTNTRCAKCVIS